MTSLLIVNGPNLNLLGQREPEIYGYETLQDITRLCENKAKSSGVEIQLEQSNHEGVLVDLLQAAEHVHAGVILNAGAYTHTSVALLDAISSVKFPVIELHLSNVFNRETFRHHSYISHAVLGVICGFGAYGYVLAIDALLRHLEGA